MQRQRSVAVRHLRLSVLTLLVVWLAGSTGMHYVGHGTWSLQDCGYHAIITIFTVGFAELPGADRVAYARVVTSTLIVFGVAAVAYMQASVTALFIENAIGEALRRSRMRAQVAKLEDHVVVAGAGSTGRYVVEELLVLKKPFVVIDRDEAQLRLLSELLGVSELLYVVGDATHDAVLRASGVQRCSGVVAALTDDAANLYVTLSARSLNAKARIVTKAVSQEAEGKMRLAGATAVVSPNTIGGRRMASELVRPEVVEFLDQMHRTEHSLRMEEIRVPLGSALVGKSLRDARLRPRTKALIIAIRARTGEFLYNPGPDTVVDVGTTLIALGDRDDVEALRLLVHEALNVRA